MPDSTPDIKRNPWKRRAAAVMGLCEQWGLTIGDDSTTGNEDINAYFPTDSDGESLTDWENHVGVVNPPEFEFGRWAAVTSAGEFNYIYPEYATKREAIEKSTRYIGDSIHNEFPACVVNLDTGKEFYPNYDKITWKAHS